MRLCTLNVHMWSDRGGRSNVDRVIELLAGLRCDVIALQEVYRERHQLLRAAETLGMHHALAASSWLGNALLSPHPLTAVEEVDITDSMEEGRCAVVATVTTPTHALDVASTHLDAWEEPTRVGEVAKLRAALARRDPAHVVMGDFNALRLADYPPGALADIAAARATHLREAPRGEVVAQLDAAGYVDLLRRAQVADDDYLAGLTRPLPFALRSTCWANTRIDYVWGAASLARRWRVAAASVVETSASDHAAVVVELTPVV